MVDLEKFLAEALLMDAVGARLLEALVGTVPLQGVDAQQQVGTRWTQEVALHTAQHTAHNLGNRDTD